MKKRLKILSIICGYEHTSHMNYSDDIIVFQALDAMDVYAKQELLSFKRFISNTPLSELELYSDEEFIERYLNQ
jgi:hypothetical protein